jgi:predicted Zn finger-like uncharacterized protein
MDHRITQCPRCGTSFRVTEAHLAVAAGAVRCGSCLHIFNAREHWAEDPTSAPPPAPATASDEPDFDDLIIDDDALFDDNTPLFADERESDQPPIDTASPTRSVESAFKEVDFNTFDEPLDDVFGNTFDSPLDIASDEPRNGTAKKTIDDSDATHGNSPCLADAPEELTSAFSDLGDWEENTGARFGRVQDLDEELSASDEEWTRDLLRDDEPLFATPAATAPGTAIPVTIDANTEPHPALDTDESPVLADLGLVAAEPAGPRREPTFGDFDPDAPAASASDELRFLDDDPLPAAVPTARFDDPAPARVPADADEADLNPEFRDTPPAHRASEPDLPARTAIGTAGIEPSQSDEPETVVTDASYALAPPAPASETDPLASLHRLAAEPLQIHRFKHEPRWPGILWGLALVVLLLSLAGQYAYKNFETLARGPARPWLAQVCNVAGCVLPPQADVGQIRSGNLVVRSHPTRQGALVVDAILTNQAAFPQPYPQLQLQFSDLNGAPVAGRRFLPAEYLAGELSGASLMPVQQPVHIALELVDPGPQAVNYALTVVAPGSAR